MIWVWLAPVALLLLGLFLLVWGRRQRIATGVPIGEVIYSDMGEWQAQKKPLLSRRYGLVGRPDYLVRTREGSKLVTVPVEVKSRRRPPEIYSSHVLQLMTYCLLVEDVLKERPPFGVLCYADATLRIPYTDDLRHQVQAIADAIRAGRHARQVSRQHNEAGRCRSCGYRAACGDEALA